MQAALGPRGPWQGDSRWHRCCAGSPDRRQPFITGSATDAADDLSLLAGANALPDPPTSFTNVTVKYEDAAGRVDVAYTFDQVPAADQEIHAGVGLGTIRADGSCSAPFFTSLGWHVPAGRGLRANLSWRATRPTLPAT